MLHIKSRFVTAFSLLLSLLLLLSMAGCGSSGSDYSGEPELSVNSMAASTAPMDAPMPRMSAQDMMTDAVGPQGEAVANTGDDAAAPDTDTDTTQRKLVKNGDMSLETKEFDTAIPALIKMIEDAGGYVERQSVDGRSIQNMRDYYERSASITARIPANKLSEITTQMGTLCNVLSQNESVDDITDRYYDAAAHLEMLRVQETRLLELLAKAETLENIIQLEQALTNCQYEIETLTGQLRRMDSQVSYSTLQLTVNEVVDYNVPQEKPRNFMERLGDAFTSSGNNLSRAMENILFFLIIDGPVVAIYLLFWGAIIYVVYRILRKRREKRQENQPTPLATPTPESRPEDLSK